MRVLIAGGTGFIGLALTRTVLERGHEVTVLARSPADAEIPDEVATICGDVTDPDSLTAAMDGPDAIINLVALSPLYSPPSGHSHETVHYAGTTNLLRAAEANDVERFIQMSAVGADPDGPTAYLRAKGNAEVAVTESDLAWTIVRPSVVFGDGGEFIDFVRWVSFPPMSNRLSWPYVSPLPGRHSAQFQPIYREDLVSLIAEILQRDDVVGARLSFGGPSVYTLEEIVRLVHAAEGKPARILPMPVSLAKVGLAVAGYIPGFPMGADQGRSLELENVPEHNDIDRFDVEAADLRSLESYLGIEPTE